MNVEIPCIANKQQKNDISLPSCRWLIEVNASPSLTASSQEDYDLKYRLLEDTLHIVDMEGRYHLTFDKLQKLLGRGWRIFYVDIVVQNILFCFSLTGKEKRVGGFDLMWNDGPVYTDVGLEAMGCSCLVANTHLG